MCSIGTVYDGDKMNFGQTHVMWNVSAFFGTDHSVNKGKKKGTWRLTRKLEFVLSICANHILQNPDIVQTRSSRPMSTATTFENLGDFQNICFLEVTVDNCINS